jgi:acyl phosphate:glycerol-3-phosphate acyltransferase
MSYLIGTIMFGYIIILLLHKEDLRLLGSKNVGARNAGRTHGKKEFILVFLGDALKGALVIFIGAEWFKLSNYLQLAGLLLTIIGHIKPVTLKFKGGKGISTFIGGMVLLEPLLVPYIVSLFFLLLLMTKSLTLAGLGSFLFIPLCLLMMDYDLLSVLVVMIMMVFIYLTHLENIKISVYRNRDK